MKNYSEKLLTKRVSFYKRLELDTFALFIAIRESLKNIDKLTDKKLLELFLSVSPIQYTGNYMINKFESKERLWQKVKMLKKQLRKNQKKL